MDVPLPENWALEAEGAPAGEEAPTVEESAVEDDEDPTAQESDSDDEGEGVAARAGPGHLIVSRSTPPPRLHLGPISPCGVLL